MPDTNLDGIPQEGKPSSFPHPLISFQLPNRLFSPSKRKTILKCVDCHAGGEPARVVLSGVPPFAQECPTALDKRNYMMEHLDYLPRILLLEPRGYPCQNANFVFYDEQREQLQYVIAEQNKIYPLMSGHNTFCVATAVLECGVVPYTTSSFTMEAPAGPIVLRAEWNETNDKVTSLTFTNTAPAFVEHLDIVVNVPEIGNVTVDVAYGGMWYAIVDIEQFPGSLSLDPRHGKQLCRMGEMIKVACREQYPVQHPTQDYPGVDILAFRSTGSAGSPSGYGKNTVIMSNTVLDWDRPETWTAMIDRSPCGTGTCAIMATLHARGLLNVGEPFVHESIVGSKFIGTIVEEATLEDGRRAIIPQVQGSAYITQYSEVVVDPEDPFQEGYRVADIW